LQFPNQNQTEQLDLQELTGSRERLAMGGSNVSLNMAMNGRKAMMERCIPKDWSEAGDESE
jgi:hypothetical protein